jgi:predicted transglutaminase-like cysteine proteinase
MKPHKQQPPFLCAAAVILTMTTPLVALAAPPAPPPGPVAAATEDAFLYVAVHEVTRPPIGWVDFCARYVGECATTPSTPCDIVLSARAFKDLARVNKWVNDAIKPMTDMDHWGMIEHWDYPDDGYGDCEDYVLLKRSLLIEAGWPREALLITVVRDKKDEGHAVLTVKTDRGEFILDNQTDDILLWFDVKRQSLGGAQRPAAGAGNRSRQATQIGRKGQPKLNV